MVVPACLELADGDPERNAAWRRRNQDFDLMKVISLRWLRWFRSSDVAVALYNCARALPDALTSVPPDIGAITACFPDHAKKLSKVLKLIPQVSLPMTIAHILDLAIHVLDDVRRKFSTLQTRLRQLERSVERARNLNDAGLMAIIACAQANIAQEARNTGKNLASLGRLLGILDILSGLIGGPKMLICPNGRRRWKCSSTARKAH
jgi:hypothetical protein